VEGLKMIDILHHISTDSAFFVTDKTAEKVSLQLPVFPAGVLQTAEGYSEFQARDNIVLLSMGIVIPLGFELWDVDLAPPAEAPIGLPEITLYYKSASLVNPDPFQRICMPFLNYELSLDKMYTIPATILTPYELLARISPVHEVRISMLSMPEALDEKTFYCPVFAKIEHTLPLQLRVI